MAKKMVIDARMHPAIVTVHGVVSKISLPEGCLGICFVFESKKSCIAWGGTQESMLEVRLEARDGKEQTKKDG